MCIIVEPMQACLPSDNYKKYLEFLYNFSKKNNLLLFFDEIFTSLGTDELNVQNLYKIKPDISTFRKCYSGGISLGFIGISNKIEKNRKI
jgi:glutamate-1-semialdehyde aminotransferase